MKYFRRASAFALLLSALVHTTAYAQEAATGRRYGVLFSGAVAGAPLGEVAESYGALAVPGIELELRLITRSPTGTEWGLGVIADEYRLSHVIGREVSARLEYSSVAVTAGPSWSHHSGGVPLRAGAEIGWRRFTVTSTRPDFYTGEVYDSRVQGDAALVAVTYSVEIPSGRMTVSPRLRLETSYPDFGGGDGYSALHRESDFGFRASAGVSLRMLRGGK